ncbi:MAG: AbrB/MazE/SpoVT family DNA-binding domain-containing protein [Candidatus Pacearchaeota archaeon]
MAIKTKVKKWGNSIGFIVPSSIAEKLNLKPGEEIEFDIEKEKNVLKDMFGKAKKKKDSRKMIKSFGKEMRSKWDK